TPARRDLDRRRDRPRGELEACCGRLDVKRAGRPLARGVRAVHGPDTPRVFAGPDAVDQPVGHRSEGPRLRVTLGRAERLAGRLYLDGVRQPGEGRWVAGA